MKYMSIEMSLSLCNEVVLTAGLFLVFDDLNAITFSFLGTQAISVV